MWWSDFVGRAVPASFTFGVSPFLANASRRIATAGMLLGETETDLRMRLGEPAYRDFANPETLAYTEANFNASYVLKNDHINARVYGTY